jgi:hypothetical protein
VRLEYVVQLTVTARLHRGLDVTNALNGNAVLVVAVNVLVLKLTNFVDQDTKLVGDVRHIVVACLTPNGELLLHDKISGLRNYTGVLQTYGNLHAFPRNQLHATHDVLLHLDQL